MSSSLGSDNDDWKDKYRALEKEYDDFREQSQSLERELEMGAETLEKNNKELKSKNNQLQYDLDTLRVCIGGSRPAQTSLRNVNLLHFSHGKWPAGALPTNLQQHLGTALSCTYFRLAVTFYFKSL